MRQFQVPQFITVEDKVFGPLTIKQFLYLGVGALLIVGVYFLNFEFYIFFPIGAAIAGLAAALAFLKINEQPFPIVLKNALLYVFRPRLYLWKKEESERIQKSIRSLEDPEVMVSTITKKNESKLSELAWSLDVKDKHEHEEEE